jgi:signal transduction histidine kinase/CheY-like chemotaxis protein/HPt (histidine-containing phosphotransfer) domain-containing protein
MEANPIFESFLAEQGLALFEYLGKGSFRPIGAFPSWLKQIWGDETARAKTVSLGELSPFLQNFLVDAEQFWDTKSSGAANSGNWIEHGVDGVETPLEASAFRLEGKKILLVRNFSASFAEQTQWLQTARDSLLEHEKLLREIQKKEILLHCIIHDLSQPLSAMRGCFNCLTIGDLPPDLKPFVETGQRESYRQEQMIRGVLEAFSGDLAAQKKSEAGEPEATADLAACARHAVRNFSAAFTEKRVRLQVDPKLDASREWISVGDAPRVDRIFGNLLENAMRYSPQNTAVTVGVEEKGALLAAFVDDEGPGLPPDQAATKLFALFAKGKDRPGKAGLGLYFCKMTVERWGGRIGAENRPGGGSRFWFCLPRAPISSRTGAAESNPVRKDHDERSQQAPASPSKQRVGKAARSLRILVADDTEINRELAMELLKARGHSIVGVADGRQALAALEKNHFDVVLMDEVMPEMNGLEATRVIRQKESGSGKHQLIIGLTGNATKEDEKRCIEAGEDAYLSKPFDMHTLFRMIESSAPANAGEVIAPPPPRTPSDSVAAHLARSAAGSKKLMQSLAKSFLADVPERIANIQTAISQKNATMLATSAHALKGSVAIFGAAKAVAAARNLETMGRARDLENASAEFRTLEHEVRSVNQELLAIAAKAGDKPTTRRPASRKKRKK